MVRLGQEGELEKRKQVQDPALPTTAKRFKHANSTPKGHGDPQCSKCRKSHEEA